MLKEIEDAQVPYQGGGVYTLFQIRSLKGGCNSLGGQRH